MESVLAGDFYRRKADRRFSGIDLAECLDAFAINARNSTKIREKVASGEKWVERSEWKGESGEWSLLCSLFSFLVSWKAVCKHGIPMYCDASKLRRSSSQPNNRINATAFARIQPIATVTQRNEVRLRQTLFLLISETLRFWSNSPLCSSHFPLSCSL